MKEFEMKTQFNAEELAPHQVGAGLTERSNPSTLEVRGNIFMDQGQNELPPQQPPVPENAKNSDAKTETPLNEVKFPQEPDAVSGAGGGEPPKEPPETTFDGEDENNRENGNQDDQSQEQGQNGDKRIDSFEQWLRNYQNLSKDEKQKALMNLLRQISPDREQMPARLIEEIIEFDETLNYFIDRIIAKPLDAETSDYSLSFYGGINLDQVKDKLRIASEADPVMKNRYERILLLTEAVKLFHNMNLQIITGNIENFVQGSRAIIPNQLQIVQNTKGVAQIMRIFDNEYQRINSENGYLTNKEYDELMGIDRDPETNEIIENERKMGTAERRFREIIKVSPDLKDMEEWEIKSAINKGKILFNITLRPAELISLGKVPAGDRQWASIPQESAARLMNWLGWTGFRFMLAQSRGGLKLAEMARENYQKLRSYHGYGNTRFKKIGGNTIEDYEISGMFGVSGVFSSWRQNLIILENAPTTIRDRDDENKLVSVRSYIEGSIENKKGEIRASLSKKGFKGEKLDEAVKEEFKTSHEAKLLRSIFLNETDGELKKEFTNALGVLLKHGNITPNLMDSQEVKKVKEEIRSAIWKRVAQDNPLALIPLLRGAKTEDGTEFLKEFEKGQIDSLCKKLYVFNEQRLMHAAKGESLSLDEIIEENEGLEYGVKLDENEKKLLSHIRNTGIELSRDFANIRFPFTPFMNDVIFENVNYGEAGSEFFRRRLGGDLPQFYEAYNQFSKLMDNPGGVSTEDALKVLHAMVEALGTPQGIETGQDKVEPFFEAYLNFIEKGGHIEAGPLTGLAKWWAKWNTYSFIKEVTRQPNSLAQKYSGMAAPSLDEVDMRKIIDEALHMGILRRGHGEWVDLYEKFRKKFKVGLPWFILLFIRDILPVSVAAAIFDLGQKTTKEKGA